MSRLRGNVSRRGSRINSDRIPGFLSHSDRILARFYCAFHKHANPIKVQKPPSQLRFSLPSIIITITSNEPWNTETHRTDRNPPIANHKPWPFEPVKVKFCFLRGPLRWMTAAKNAIVSLLLNFRIRMFVKSAVTWIFFSIKNILLMKIKIWPFFVKRWKPMWISARLPFDFMFI